MTLVVDGIRTHSACFSDIAVCQRSQLSAQLNTEGWIIKSASSAVNDTVITLLNDKKEPVAAVIVAPALGSVFQSMSKLSESALSKTFYIDAVWVAGDVKLHRVLPLILYFALRSGRILGMENIVALIAHPNAGVPLATVLRMEAISKVQYIDFGGKSYGAMAQRLSYSMTKLYEQLHDEDLAILPRYFIEEIVETHAHWLQRFFKGSWARAIIEERISKEQYICSLYNLHQYVKYTTRLCARCIAHSDDLPLRNHYIHHLKGEINHELIIENDLKVLGADVEYLKAEHVPMAATNEFISIQESTIGFKQDAILMLACPLVAEGITAHMDRSFVEHLYRVISSWGVSEPEKAAKFISSHINFDGGEDGHWLGVVSMMQKYILTETRLQQFLCIMQTAMNGIERGFNATIDNLKLWEEYPNNDAS